MIVQIHTDPLSQVIALLRPQSALSTSLDIGGSWSFRFAGHEGIKFNAIMHGHCWLQVGDTGPWHDLAAGDCFLLTKGLPFTLASEPTLRPADAAMLYADVTGPIVSWNGGGDLFLIGGRFSFPDPSAAALIAALPPVIVISGGAPDAAVLRWALGQLAEELAETRPGGGLLSDHLSHFMLVHVLRLHLAERRDDTVSWLNALTDRQLSRALTGIHADIARSWSLADLAGLAGMSRSAFAQRFQRLAGLSPMDYLTNWRMAVARDRLRHSGDPIARIAHDIGYQSEAAFSTAFKRVTSTTPRAARTAAG